MKLERELKWSTRGQHKSSRTVRVQMLEAESEAKDKSSRPRTKFWPRGQLGLEDLTSLVKVMRMEGEKKLSIICIKVVV